MTSPHDIKAEGATLEPVEYLRLLGMLEERMPPGTRAYLVHVTDDGRRELTLVPETASVLDVSDGLLDYLKGRVLLADQWLLEVRDYCNQRLERQGGDPRSAAEQKATVLASQCAQIAHDIEYLAGLGLDDDSTDVLMPIQRLSRQLGWMADLATSELGGGEGQKGGAEQWMLLPVCREMAERQA